MRKKSRPFRFLWITDPWDTLDHPKDTTLRLAEEALALGAEVFWCDVKTIRWENGETRLDASQILRIYPGRLKQAFHLAPAVSARPDAFDSVHYRTDPPVDLAYLQPLQILMMGLEPGRLVNSGDVLLQGNEKLEASNLGSLMPASIASAQWESLKRFGISEGKTVLKPLHQAQSKGVELLDWTTREGEKKAKQSLTSATEGFTRPVLLQRYLKKISEGEQRLWFVDGKLLACVRKLPLPRDFRVDMDRGSRLARTELTPDERKAAKKIGAHLVQRKIRLAAVDLIEGLVTDFNFTSPGLITQMEGVLGVNLARPIIEALMNPMKQTKSKKR